MEEMVSRVCVQLAKTRRIMLNSSAYNLPKNWHVIPPSVLWTQTCLLAHRVNEAETDTQADRHNANDVYKTLWILTKILPKMQIKSNQIYLLKTHHI